MSEVLTTEYEGCKIRSVMIDDDRWFVAKDVADALGYIDSSKAYKYTKNMRTFKASYSLGLHPATKLCNQSDLISMLSSSRLCGSVCLDGLTSALLGEKPIINVTICSEIVAIKTIEQILNKRLHRQYPCGKYKIDAYDKVNKIAYEIDEPFHRLQREADAERQAYIEDQLGCTFVRIKL